ncbi:MAG: DUF2007 domain-containing protein [bacterium]
MFCPKCKAEYRSGFTVCADCDVPLVDKLPEEKELPQKPPYKQLKALFNTAEIAVIKSIFDDAKIDYYFKGEHFQAMHVPLLDPSILMIREDHFEEAEKLLEELE